MGGLGGGDFARAQEGVYATIGTGSVSGVYYALGSAICRQMNQSRKEHGVNCSAEATEGSIYNIGQMRANEYNFSVVQSDWQYHAMTGSSKFREAGPYSELRAVFSAHPEPFTVLARAGTGITTFDDLKGKKVNLGPLDSGQRATTEALLKVMGWSLDDFAQVGTLNATDQSKALCDGEYDAIVYTVGHPNRSVGSAARSCDVAFVSVPADVVAKVLELGGYFSAVTIPIGTYREIEDPADTFGVRATLVTKASAPDDIVYALVKATFENLGDVKRMDRALGNLKPEEMVSEGLTAPLHPGARRYYEEVGLLPAAK
ncbi:MAG: TAXI family TRAP transporter solute-binding subunit [Rhodospirillum sp.]|nr:TAXI family TRAP transporter solute-binding subunit [Rhodospirillum sp.]MCF8491454.1 TAXI family TRAP transporter solute-binding subunit [Rhodospirillum sp.]MCF8498862.1 TAXI family TRAP transporter solute-binding subunit [Rhodospirillum sp.]